MVNGYFDWKIFGDDAALGLFWFLRLVVLMSVISGLVVLLTSWEFWAALLLITAVIYRTIRR
jgi:hypothetical protein